MRGRKSGGEEGGEEGKRMKRKRIRMFSSWWRSRKGTSVCMRWICIGGYQIDDGDKEEEKEEDEEKEEED